MNENKKIKVSVLRLLAFSLVLCLVTVAVFAVSEVIFERLSRKVDATSDDTKNTRWLMEHAENLMLLPIIAAVSGLFYRKNADDRINALYHREKKYQLLILLAFLYLVFLPYYISQNIAGDMTVFEALGDKALWFATQFIPILALIMYQSDRQNKCTEQLNEIDG